MLNSQDQKRLKLLQLAQAILTEESTKQFNENYSQWIRTSGAVGRTTGITPPVPVPPPPPTEAEIVAKALEFYQAGQRTVSNTPSIPLPPPPPPLDEQLALVEIAGTGAPVSVESSGASEPIIAEVLTEMEPTPEQHSPESAALELDPIHKIFQSPVDESPRFKELFTNWLQRNSLKQGVVT